jgi:hypothetical protein
VRHDRRRDGSRSIASRAAIARTWQVADRLLAAARAGAAFTSDYGPKESRFADGTCHEFTGCLVIFSQTFQCASMTLHYAIHATHKPHDAAQRCQPRPVEM